MSNLSNCSIRHWWTYKCKDCGNLITDEIYSDVYPEYDSWEQENKPCPKCNGKVRANQFGYEPIGKHSLADGDCVIENVPMGCNPNQIPEMMKVHPGSEYNPRTGALITKGFHAQEQAAIRRGMAVD